MTIPSIFNFELIKALAALFIALQKAGHIIDENKANLFYTLFADFKLLIKPVNIDTALAEFAETGFYTNTKINYETAAIPPVEGYPATFHGTHFTDLDPNPISFYDYPASGLTLKLNPIEPERDLIDLIKRDDDPFNIMKKFSLIEPLDNITLKKQKLIDKDQFSKPENIINPKFGDTEPEDIIPLSFTTDKLEDFLYDLFVSSVSLSLRIKMVEFKDLIVPTLMQGVNHSMLHSFFKAVFN